MARQGKWILHKKMNRCTGKRKCAACATDPDRKPHGPYYSLRRRSPIDGKQEGVYIGRMSLSDFQMHAINERFQEQPVPPTREEVITVASLVTSL